MKNQDHLAASQKQFNLICEAYDVLSNTERKAVYDKNGEAGLKNGIPKYNEDTKTFSNALSAGYCFKGNTFDIFQNFFGSTNPFTDFFISYGDAALKKDKLEGAPADIVVVLNCSIYEFYNGSLKTFNYTKDVLQPDGRTVEQIEGQMTIEVKPGYDCETVLSFPTKGNEAFAQYQSALLIKFDLDDSDLKNNYKRKGDNLWLTQDMLLEDALISRPIHFKTLDGRSININLDTMITP